MSTTHITPTPGRIVWYRGADGATRPGIVTKGNGPFNADLYVFPLFSSDTDCGLKGSVTHADPEQEPGCLQSWHWMPYQKQQAEKHAQENQQLGGAILANATRAGWAGAGLDFGTALLALKDGKRVARAGWNGKDMWLILVPGTPRAELREGTPYAKALQESACEILPHIDMWTVNAEGRRAMLPGWLASQSDMLADDWQTV